MATGSGSTEEGSVLQREKHSEKLVPRGPRVTRNLETLHKFSPDVEELATYLKRADIFFAANDMSNALVLHW